LDLFEKSVKRKNDMKMVARIPAGSRPPLTLASLLGLGLATLVTGEGLAGDFASCSTIPGDRERLACYDRAAALVAKPAPPGTVATAASQPMTLPTTPVTSRPQDGASPEPAVAGDEKPVSSLLTTAWALSPDSARYGINLYRPNYILFARWSDNPNEHPFTPLFPPEDLTVDDVEARFQLSFKFRLWATDDRRFGVWAAYTQQNQWQLYNDDKSKPFRETNYEPELMVSYNPDLDLGGGFHWRLFNFGLNHQSNGRTDVLSRSWDRVIATFGFERDNLVLLVRPWVRIAENDEDDDNPDIEDYLGYGDITGIYKWRGHSFTLMGRGNPSTGKGAALLSWTSPPFLGPLRGYIQAFTGYGDSMIDYNWSQNAIGIGVALNDLLDQPIQGF
jgi:phospholipase A1